MRHFSNPAFRHRTRRIAIDGSQELPRRLIATLADRRATGQPIDALALSVAAWMRWQAGRTDAGEAFEIEDPLADRLARATGVDALLKTIGATLDDEARRSIATRLAQLERIGASAAIASLTAPHD